jgi:CheY-like chemotaxis protein
MKPLRDNGLWRTAPGGESKAERPALLYVEDDAQNRLVAGQRLGESYELLMAPDDREACELVKAHHDRIGCVLMDIQLQGSVLSGLDLCRLMRGLPLSMAVPAFAQGIPVLRVPIIFLTSYGSLFADKELTATGGNYLFAKPIDFDRLSTMLKQLLSQRLLLGSFSRE